MKLSTRLGVSLGALGLVVLTTSQAQAQVVNGTFGFVPIGRLTYTGPSLDTATSIALPGLEIVNNVDGATYLDSPNQFNGGAFALTLGQTVQLDTSSSLFTAPMANTTMLSGSPLLTFVAGGLTFNYTITQITSFTGISTPPGASLAFNTIGTLTSTGTTNQLAQLSGSFTQTSPGAAVNGSFTFSTPIAAVPEPSSVALVLSMSLTGAGFLARRKNARKGA